jgi:hypothetical protein
MKNLFYKVLLALFLYLLYTGTAYGAQYGGTENPGVTDGMICYDYSMFEGTEAWKLAKAVRDGKIKAIKKIAKKNPELVNYREPRRGFSLLDIQICVALFNDMLGIKSPKDFESFHVLLEVGANMNYRNKLGLSPLSMACALHFDVLLPYVDELLKHGADVNYQDSITDDSRKRVFTHGNETPLIRAAESGNLEAAKKLVQYGADVNYIDNNGCTALGVAAYAKYGSLDVILFLLQNGADCTKPICYSGMPENEPLYLATALRLFIIDLNGADYATKREIIKILDEHGIHYDDVPVPDDALKLIKELFPNTWEYYITKY